MALEATHIRFALDIKDQYKIDNIVEYVQGSIYPDSRYISGIDRGLTHNEAVLSPEFVTSDFKAGWQVHQLCDKIQNQVFQETIPGYADLDRVKNHAEWWTSFTAAKILADRKDAQSFEIETALAYLNSTICPNGEDLASIKKYFRIITDLYRNKTVLTIDDYITMWNEFGVDNDLVDGVRTKTKHLLDTGQDGIIFSCYDKMIESARNGANQ